MKWELIFFLVVRTEGVEDVKADCGSNKLTVKGKVDPTWLREKVEQKTKKKVELLSPLPKKEAPAGDKKSDEKPAEKKVEEKKKDEEKKPKEVNTQQSESIPT